MPSEPNDAAYLWDMLDAAKAVQRFLTGRTSADYQDDEMLRAAVERKIEVIGEAARGVSDALKQAHPAIPWRKIIAQRHVLAHEYGVIQDSLIWKVATVHIPVLVTLLEPLVPTPPGGEG